ncbi:MAG: DHA2 family efflux MFS transporter permease subunit [Nocardioides sp.]|uniref:DHA2 family efflux MFS transporter permease subunit n=1 Tax=Nocardioides sp. TaxID=35761 RepID=UPI003F1139C0
MSSADGATVPAGPPGHLDETMENPWPALWALVLGFFMLMVDSSILTVATPAIIADLDAGVGEVIWVTSAYLLAYVVPLLVTGRLGDRYGPRRLFLVGLVVFTLASLWCGLAGGIGSLIAARAVQGLGAALMSPQTMAVITRIFPIHRRGPAMAMWGAAAGVATLVGPLLGGFLVEHLGWEWIFFINAPVGAVALVLTLRNVPDLVTHEHRFDWLGVALFGTGMFSLVFGIQEGSTYDWGHIAGPVTVWRLIGTGLVLLAVFVWWQSRNTAEPLLPLHLFKDRNFSVANLAIATVSFSFTSMGFPLMLYAQSVRGWGPLASGLLMAPMAVATFLMARQVGRLTDRLHPRLVIAPGFALALVSMTVLVVVLTPGTAVWVALLLMFTMGVGGACLWGPLSATANRNLPPHHAGAGAGVYNTTRQIGAVLGSAVVALLLDSRLRAHGLPSTGAGDSGLGSGQAMPPELAGPFTEAFAEALWLVPVALGVGLVVALLFEVPRHFASRPAE